VSPIFTNNGISCLGTPDQFILTINPTPSIYGLQDQFVCANTQTLNIPVFGPVSGTQYNWISSNPLIGSAITGNGNIAPFTGTNTSLTPINSDFTISPSFTNNNVTCFGADSVVNITVLPLPNVNLVNDQTICNGDLSSFVSFSSTINTNVSFAWTNNNNLIGLPSSGNGNINSFSVVNNSTIPVYATISVTGSFNTNNLTCFGNATTFDFEINPTPILNLVTDQTFCNNEISLIDFSTIGMNGVTYEWVNTNTSTGIPASGSGDINFIASNTTNSTITTSITVTPIYLNNGVYCSGQTQTFEVNVNPIPTIDFVANQIICESSTVSVNFTSALGIAGTEYNWTNSNTNIGLPASGNGNITFNATNTTSGLLTGNISVTPTYINLITGNQCTGTPQTFQITVNPTPFISPISIAPVCANNTVAAINFVSDVTNTQFNWTNSNTAIGIGASGSGNIPAFVGTNTTNASITGNFTVTGTYTNNGVFCTSIPQNFDVTVDPVPTVDFVANQTVCENQSVTVNFNSSFGVVVTNYSWTNNNIATGLPASGNGNITFNPSNISGGPQTSLVTVMPSFTNLLSGNQCIGTPQIFQITINPRPILADIDDTTLCVSTQTNLIQFTSDVNGVQYTWTNNNGTIGTSISGTGDIPGFTGLNTTNSINSGNFSATGTYVNNGVSCSSSPFEIFTINVVPVINITAINNQTYCANSVTPQIPFNSNFASANFLWTNSTPAIGSLPSSGTGTSLPPFTTSNTTSSVLNSTITVTPFYAFNNNLDTCYGNPLSFVISVIPNPNVVTPQNQIVCAGSPTTAVVFNSNPFVSGVIYNWTNSNPNIGLPASGTGTIPSFIGTNPINLPNPYVPISGTITIQPMYIYNGDTCLGNISTFTITVLPSPDVTANPVGQILCGGANTLTVNFGTNVSGSGSISYNYGTVTNLGTNPLNPANVNPLSGSGNLNSFQTNSGITTVTIANYTVTSTYTYQNVSCTSTPLPFSITVVPTPDMSDPPNQIVCTGDQTDLVNFASNVLNTNYTWTNNNTTTGFNQASGNTTSIPSFTGLNTGNTANVSLFTVTPTFTSNGLTCTGTPEQFTISITPTPTITSISNNAQVLCAGNPILPIQIIGSISGTIYQWSNDNPSIGLSANGNGNIASFNVINNTNLVQTANITITPIIVNTGNSPQDTCVGQAQTFSITVVPRPIMVDPSDLVLCIDEVAVLNPFTSNINSTTYSWANNNTDIGLVISGNGNIAPFTVGNPFNYPITSTITVTPNYTYQNVGCTGNNQQFTVTVNPIPTMVDPSDVVFCNNQSTTPINFSSNVTGTSYAWSNLNPNIGLGTNGTGSIGSFNAINNTTIPIITTISVQSSFTNAGYTCTGNNQTFTITVNPTATLLNPDVTICSEDTLDIDFITSIPATFQWSALSNSNVQGETVTPIQTTTSINDILVNTTGTAQAVTYLVSTVSNTFNCPAGPYQIDVAVNPLPVPVFTIQNNPTCDDVPILFVNNTLGNNTYNWNFGDGNSAQTVNASNVYENVGPYTITLTATNIATGCIDSVSQDITILPSPEVGFTVSQTIACESVNIIFIDTVDAPNTDLYWDFGDGGYSYQNGSTDYQYNSVGCFDISLTVTATNGCVMSQTLDDLVCVAANPIADFTVENPNLLVDDPTAVFINQSIGAQMFDWDFGDGYMSTAVNPIHNYQDIGEYFVSLYATNEFGCVDSANFTITLYEDLVLYVPNTFTPNEDGTNDEFLPIINDVIDPSSYKFQIFNRWGELLFESQNKDFGWDGTYGLTSGINCQNGTYTWKLYFKLQKEESYRIYAGHLNLLR
jgi:gliding motility-associated-like protein